MPQAIINSYITGVVPDPPTPTAWWRSDFGVEKSGGPAVNGGLVDFWENMTGDTLWDATQTVLAEQPTYNTGVLNGHPAINFPRTPNQQFDVISAPSSSFPATNNDFAFFAVIRPTNFASAMNLTARPRSSGTVQWFVDTAGKQVWSDGTASAASTTALTAGAWNRIGLRVPVFASGSVHYYLNGAADGSPSQGVSGGAGSAALGLFGAPAFVFPLIGDAVEFLFYTRDVTPAEVTQIDNYFKARYGLA